MRYLLVITLLWGLSGCHPAVTAPDKLRIPPLPPPRTVGSLWVEENGRAYLYEDMRAARVGDVLTVHIVESHKGSKSAQTGTSRESSMNSALQGNTIGIPPIRLSTKAASGFSLDASLKNSFNGKGSTNREDTLTGTISVVVTEVLPNGDLRVEGQREVTINSEQQMMTVSGIVRRVDIDTRNTVLSSAIADARIRYTGLGVVDEVQRPGWFMRIMSYVSPF